MKKPTATPSPSPRQLPFNWVLSPSYFYSVTSHLAKILAHLIITLYSLIYRRKFHKVFKVSLASNRNCSFCSSAPVHEKGFKEEVNETYYELLEPNICDRVHECPISILEVILGLNKNSYI